jgi:hypothetical protein
LPHVQFWVTENSWRLDRAHRGSHRRDIPCLVDASDVRTVNAIKTAPVRSMSVVAIYRQLRFVSRHFYSGKDVRVLAPALNANFV